MMSAELNNIDLTIEQRKEIIDLLRHHLPDTEVWAYGSRVKFTSKPSSDLDMVTFASKEQRSAVANLKEAFEESNLPFRVDLFIWDEVPEQFHKNIKKNHVVLQHKGRGSVLEREWKESTLKELSSGVSYGYTESASSDKVGPHFLRITDIQNGVVDWPSVPYCPITEKDHQKYKLQAGDIVVARTGNSTGENYIFEGDHDAVYASYLIRFRIDESLAYPKFVWYFMRSASWWNFIEGAKTGSAQAGANAKILGRFPLTLPPLPEQKAIAHILGSLDDKIELNRKMNATLEAMAQALFKSWFVDFDPVIDNILRKNSKKYPSPSLSHGERDANENGDDERIFEGIPDALRAKAEARKALGVGSSSSRHLVPAEQELGDPGENNSELIHHNSSFSSLFPDSFQPSEEMGWIPKGWEASTIGEEVDSVGGTTPSTKNSEFWNDGDIHWTTPKDLSSLSSNILLHTNRKITKAGLKKISSGLLPVDTVLMSSRAPVGYLALAKVPVAINQGYIAMKCSKQLTPEYVMQWANSVMDDIKLRAGGTTFAEISKKSFRGIPVIVPAIEVLGSYSKTIKSFYSKITDNLKESSQISKLRNVLLPKLISGELRIEDAEKIIEESLSIKQGDLLTETK